MTVRVFPPPTISFWACLKCSSFIADAGLCSFDCEEDGNPREERPESSVKLVEYAIIQRPDSEKG